MPLNKMNSKIYPVLGDGVALEGVVGGADALRGGGQQRPRKTAALFDPVTA